MPRTDSKKSTGNEQLTASRIILFAQSLSVLASISGLIGLAIAYKALKRNSTRPPSQQPPTIG